MNTFFDSLPEALQAPAQTLALLLGAVAGAIALHAVVYWIAHRVTYKTPNVADSSIVTHTRRAARLVFVLLAIQFVLPTAGLDEQALSLARHTVSILLIASITWLVIRSVSVIDDVIMSTHRIDVADNLAARRVRTQTRVLARTIIIIAGVVGMSAILMTFPSIRQLGASLLASAGIAGLVIGMAARPTIANLLAGLQLAITQPIRLDDVVIVEGEWGKIEEIATTYIVVRIWDERRLVVPLEYFISNPFQNWTRRTADILGTVFIHTDYTVPVQAVRDHLQRIVKDNELWDGRVCGLQVTASKENTLELRALVSAADASKAWDLRCEVREQLVAFLQEHHPRCLPRVRAELHSEADTPLPAAATPSV